MRALIVRSVVLSLAVLILAGISTSLGAPALINLMVDADQPDSPSEDEVNESITSLTKLTNALAEEKLRATIYISQDAVASREKIWLTNLGRSNRMEMAMTGTGSGERLSEKSYEEQEEILERSKKYAEACHVCGVNEIGIVGFMPQNFDQNEDTYNVLDDLGIHYNAGFQEGLIYASGHEVDIWPYKVEGHDFYAVPISSHELSGERVPLYDRSAREDGLTGSEWYDLLQGKFEEASSEEDPMVILLTASVSGNGDYLDALKEFIDYALSNGAEFGTTLDLLNISVGEVGVASSAVTEAKESSAEDGDESDDESDCPECDEMKKRNISINGSINGTSGPVAVKFEPNFGE